MLYALIENNSILKIGSLFELFPNVSFPVGEVDNDFLNNNSVLKVIEWVEHDTSTEKLVYGTPYINGDSVFTFTREFKTEQELTEEQESNLIFTILAIRTQRNQLLKDSDWTQVADAPVDKTAWATYRQELRDITSQEGFPFNVVFPNPPL
jgi:hypothetical protein